MSTKPGQSNIASRIDDDAGALGTIRIEGLEGSNLSLLSKSTSPQVPEIADGAL